MRLACAQMGSMVLDNQLQNRIFGRVLMIKLNEIIKATGVNVKPVTRQDYIEIANEWKALLERPDSVDHREDWLEGREITPYVKPEEDETAATGVPESVRRKTSEVSQLSR